MGKIKRFIKKNTIYGRWLIRYNTLDSDNQLLLKYNREILNSQKYHDTIIDYDWLKYKGISPGEYAVDYGFCYTLVRTLNAMHPLNILECGLGQSSHIIHQYAAFYKTNALTCEHDKSWASFFINEVNGRYPVNIKTVNLEHTTIKGHVALTYKNLANILSGEKYDLILIDGPYYSPHYSRPQIIDLCKNNLNDRFCIIMDDCDREGEQETLKEIKTVLQNNNISFYSTIYSSYKEHAIICSSDLAFLTTL